MTISADLVAAYACVFVHTWDHYAVQQRDGSYWRVAQPLSLEGIAAHLARRWTLGTYLLDQASCCAFAVFDADSSDGLAKLVMLQHQLAGDGMASLLEASRRGGHLWVHFTEPTLASQVRAWLLPYAQTYGVEFYPTQDGLGVGGSGSLIRLPLGVHRRSRGWYPFLAMTDGGLLVPVGDSVVSCCTWAVEALRRVSVPDVGMVVWGRDQEGCADVARDWPGGGLAMRKGYESIRGWCQSQDCRAVIGRWVDLDRRGVGSCPFKEHHYRGDRRPSLSFIS